MIPRSGYGLAPAFEAFDAERRFDVASVHADESPDCIAGEVLRGRKKPHECAAFGTRVHARAPARRADGLGRGRVRGVPPVRPPRRGGPRVSDAPPDFGGLSCPVPVTTGPTVQLSHGGGGRMSKALVDRIFLPAFRNAALAALHDGAVLPAQTGRLAFTTDSYVVRPIFFPGGDIGSLAVHGTVNDLAMCGARPLALSAGFILEEGFPLADLERVVASMRDAAAKVGVSIVTGDTKVVDRGKGDGIYVNTTGIGVVPDGVDIAPTRVRAGRQDPPLGLDRAPRDRDPLRARGPRVHDDDRERLGGA